MIEIKDELKSLIDTYNENYDYFIRKLDGTMVTWRSVFNNLSDLNKNFEKAVPVLVDEFYD